MDDIVRRQVMIRLFSTRVGAPLLAVATILMVVPTADAQLLRRRARAYSSDGYQQVYYNPGPGNMLPGYAGVTYSGSGMPIGMGTQGYYRGIQGYGYTIPYTGSTIAPGYSIVPSGAVTMPGASPGVPSGATSTPGASPGETQSQYRPPAGAASITVRLPANARLSMNDQPTTPTGAQRLFVTPATLESGKTYYLTLKAQWEENGQPVTRERTLEFKSGDTVTVDLMQNPPMP
jgi:uncharacterized protein (TIGR03000 family)